QPSSVQPAALRELGARDAASPKEGSMSLRRSLDVFHVAALVERAAARGAPPGGGGPGRPGPLALACLPLLVLASLFTAGSAMGGQTHPFQGEFTGSDTTDGSLSRARRVRSSRSQC